MNRIKIILFLFVLFFFQLSFIYGVTKNKDVNTKFEQISKIIVATIDGSPIYFSDYKDFINLFKKTPATKKDN